MNNDTIIKFINDTIISLLTRPHDLRSYGYGDLDPSINIEDYVSTAAQYLCSVVEQVKELYETDEELDEEEDEAFNEIADEALVAAIPIIESVHFDSSIKYYERYREILKEMIN